jgi:hypothetical protein
MIAKILPLAMLICFAGNCLAIPDAFVPNSRDPFIVGSYGYSGRFGSELGLGIANMSSGGSGQMVVAAQAVRIKLSDFDRHLVGISFDLGFVGVLNGYLGLTGYFNVASAPFHLNFCVGILANLCARVGKDEDKGFFDLAFELII